MRVKYLIIAAAMTLVAGTAVATSGIPLEDLAYHALCYIGLDGEIVHLGHSH